MTRQWILALTGLGAEPEVVTHLGERRPAVRRVTDLVDLLSIAQPAIADGVLISARFPQMTREVAHRLARSGIPVWGLFDAGDDVGERMLRDWGVAAVAVAEGADVDALLAESRPPEPDQTPAGRVVAVTGPAGAPGRSTVAVNLAAQWSSRCLLIDGDTAAPSLGFQLGLPAGVPGTRGAGREASLGRLTPATLAAACHQMRGGLVVLPGAPPGAGVPDADGLLEICTRTRPITVVDCGVVGAEGLGSAGLARAGIVVMVALPTPLGIRRLIDDLPALRHATGAPLVVVWNQVRAMRQHGGLGPTPVRRLATLTSGFAPDAEVAGLPWDPRAVARTMAGTLTQHAPRSALHRGIASLAVGIELLGNGGVGHGGG